MASPRRFPYFGALALGAQRLVPVLQQAYGAWSYSRGGPSLLQDTLELLDQPLPGYADQPAAKPLPFRQHISLNQLSFRYGSETPWVPISLDFAIAKR